MTCSQPPGAVPITVRCSPSNAWVLTRPTRPRRVAVSICASHRRTSTGEVIAGRSTGRGAAVDVQSVATLTDTQLSYGATDAAVAVGVGPSTVTAASAAPATDTIRCTGSVCRVHAVFGK